RSRPGRIPRSLAAGWASPVQRARPGVVIGGRIALHQYDFHALARAFVDGADLVNAKAGEYAGLARWLFIIRHVCYAALSASPPNLVFAIFSIASAHAAVKAARFFWSAGLICSNSLASGVSIIAPSTARRPSDCSCCAEGLFRPRCLVAIMIFRRSL